MQAAIMVSHSFTSVEHTTVLTTGYLCTLEVGSQVLRLTSTTVLKTITVSSMNIRIQEDRQVRLDYKT